MLLFLTLFLCIYVLSFQICRAQTIYFGSGSGFHEVSALAPNSYGSTVAVNTKFFYIDIIYILVNFIRLGNEYLIDVRLSW
jgi:hypothetical protein